MFLLTLSKDIMNVEFNAIVNEDKLLNDVLSRIVLIHVTHRWASTSILTKYYIDNVDLVVNYFKDYVEELFILQTCHRVEYYFYVKNGVDVDTLINRLKSMYYDLKKVNDLSPFRITRGLPVLQHLLRLSAGLESAVIGENEILGQIESAYEKFLKSGYIKTILKFLVERCIRFGKYVRSTTKISEGPHGLGALAVEYVRNLFKDKLSRVKVLVIGAGTTGFIVAKEFYDKDIRNVVILNRTIEKAEVLAKKFNFTYDTLNEENLRKYMENVDVVVSAITIDKPIITKELIGKLRRKPTLIIDLGMPRNVEDLDDVRVVTIDDLSRLAQMYNEAKLREIEKVENMVREETIKSIKLLKRKYVEIELSKFFALIENIRRREIEKALNRGLIQSQELSKIEILLNSVLNKSLRPIIEFIKQVAENESLTKALNILNSILNIAFQDKQLSGDDRGSLRQNEEGPKR